MGKIVKLKNKKTGVRVYPVTATSAVVDANSGERLNDTLQNKVEEAPMDGNQYVRTNGVWSVAQMATSIKEKCIITLASNQGESDAASLYGATVKVTNVDSAEVYYEGVWNGEPIELEFAAGINYKISVGNVEKYSTPEDKTLTALESNIRNINMVYNTEIVTVNVSGLEDGFTISVKNEDGSVISTQTTTSGNHKVAYGTTYKVVASLVDDYNVTNEQTFTANSLIRVVSVVYEYVPYRLTTIRLNQTISDPATMITRIVDQQGIESIRANSHRYTGFVNSGKMYLKQLDDNDGTRYVDGTPADLTTLGTDVWMKLPKFYYKSVKYADNIFDISFAYGSKPDDTYKEWDDRQLIGVYKAAWSNDTIYSISGYTHTNDENASYMEKNVKTAGSARGNGFSNVTWQQHCMMAFLFYAYYGNTNAQAVCGTSMSGKFGNGGRYNNTGLTDELGMEDTFGTDYTSPINFWGLEMWWGGYIEAMSNIECDGTNWIITENDGTTRTIPVEFKNTSGTQYIKKMYIGENLDMIPVSDGASGTTGYCDVANVGGTCVYRSGGSGGAESGVAYNTATYATSNAYAFYNARLAYIGDYELI